MSKNTTGDEQALEQLDLDQMGSPDSASKPLKVGQIIELERRVGAGLPISDEEHRQLMAAREAIQKAFHGVHETFARIAEQMRPVLAKLPDAMGRFAQWQKDMSAMLAPIIAQMVASYREMPPKIQVALLELGKHGWYLDGGLGFAELWELEKWFAAGDAAKVDAYLTSHFESRLAEIEDELIKALPRREAILRAAFAAHRREEFVLSVPTLLAQADGVCLDLTGFYLFIKDRQLRAPQVARHVADVALDAFSAALLSPLTQVLPINASGQERDRMVQDQGLPTWQELNRHLVLHGESVDYGTRVNSLKAIALINYLVGFVRQKQAGATQSVGLATVPPAGQSDSP